MTEAAHAAKAPVDNPKRVPNASEPPAVNPADTPRLSIKIQAPMNKTG